MASGVELATAYVSLTVDGSKIAPEIKKQFGSVQTQADGTGRTVGSRLASGIGRTLKRGVIGAGLASGGVLAASLTKGFGRLNAIDQAEAKLTGLGNSTEKVARIMENATTAVTGTAFGLDEAATTAAGAVAAGVKPGEQLERTLTLVGDAATIAGVGMDEMGSIFNKVAASDMIQGDVLAQLGDKGIPILQLLGKEMGVSATEVRKLASQGEIDFATFQAAMESGLGGAAQESGKTFSGALANMNAALGRVGAKILGGVFSKMPEVFMSVGSALDTLGPAAERVGAAIGEWLATDGAALFDKVRGGVEALLPVLGEVVKVGVGVIKFFNDHRTTALILAAAMGTLLAVTQAHAAAMAVSAAGGLAAWLKATKPVVAITRAWTAVQWALNLAMSANPLGLIITGLVALGAGLVLAYKKSETFRNIVDKGFAVVKGAAQAVASFFTTKVPAAFEAVKSAASTALGWIKQNWPTVLAILTGPFGLAVLAIVKNWDRIKSKGVEVLNWIKGIPGRITGALGDLGSLLLDAGRDILQGLWNGLKEKWEDVKAWFGSITDMIPNIKGPAKRDRKLLTPAGRMIMRGLLDGLRKGQPRLERFLKRVTKAIERSLANKEISKSVAKQMMQTGNAVDKQLTRIERRYSRHMARLGKLQNDRKAMMNSVAGSITGELDLGSTVSQPNQFGFGGGQVTFEAVSARVRTIAQRAGVLGTRIKQMLKAGIPRGLVQEVQGLGIEEGIAVADALLSGNRTQIRNLRSDWGAMNHNAKRAGSLLAGGFYDAGIQAQRGLIRGLLRGKALRQAARTLANVLTKEMRRALGIKSPSTVMADLVGVPMAQGVAAGFVGGAGAASRTIQAGTDRMIPNAPQAGAGQADADLAALLGRLTVNVTVGADTRTKAHWYIDGKQAAEVLA